MCTGDQGTADGPRGHPHALRPVPVPGPSRPAATAAPASPAATAETGRRGAFSLLAARRRPPRAWRVTWCLGAAGGPPQLAPPAPGQALLPWGSGPLRQSRPGSAGGPGPPLPTSGRSQGGAPAPAARPSALGSPPLGSASSGASPPERSRWSPCVCTCGLVLGVSDLSEVQAVRVSEVLGVTGFALRHVCLWRFLGEVEENVSVFRIPWCSCRGGP